MRINTLGRCHKGFLAMWSQGSRNYSWQGRHLTWALKGRWDLLTWRWRKGLVRHESKGETRDLYRKQKEFNLSGAEGMERAGAGAANSSHDYYVQYWKGLEISEASEWPSWSIFLGQWLLVYQRHQKEEDPGTYCWECYCGGHSEPRPP